MDIESLKSLSRISRSLWGEYEKSLAMSETTLTHVGLLRREPSETLERASKVLIERAERAPPRLLSLQHPFFRLAPIELFLLTALHIEHWSYERIGRILGLEPRLVGPWAWAVRMKFCFQEVNASVEYPRGPTALGPSCPSYELTDPWSQRMMDDEMGKRERSFLQNHLMACTACRKTLESTRKLYFTVEGMIPVKEATAETEASAHHLQQVWTMGIPKFRPIETTFAQSISAWFSKPSVQYSLAGLVLIVVLTLRKSV